MRFYFQDSGQKVATKCIRVASDATSQAVIETLIEKFRADMRMLSLPEYALYEIHENGGKYQVPVTYPSNIHGAYFLISLFNFLILYASPLSYFYGWILVVLHLLELLVDFYILII